jgi:hypothetical protein
MHLKVVLQGNLGHYTSEVYASAQEFRELQTLLDRGEIAVADDLAEVGERLWPELTVILCNFWCRANDVDGETVKHYRKDKVLEASTCVDQNAFRSKSNEERCDALFFRALTLAASGFRKHGRDGGEVEAIRDKHFPKLEAHGDF